MVRLVAPRDSICIFIIWCVHRTASLGCHCSSSTVEKTSSKSPLSSLQRFFSGWGPEEGGSHSSGGALIKSTKSFWCAHSHQSVSSKEKWALLTLKIRKETSLASAWFLVFLLRIPHHLRLCEDGKHPPLVWWEDSMLMLQLGRRKTFEDEEFTGKAFCSFGVRRLILF